jgi:hypothetical protein
VLHFLIVILNDFMLIGIMLNVIMECHGGILMPNELRQLHLISHLLAFFVQNISVSLADVICVSVVAPL